jgi:hypothetical protein
MADQTTITVALTLVLKPEANITLEDKEAFVKQVLIDQANSVSITYDYGITVQGSVASDLTGTTVINLEKPDYTE